MSTELLNFCPFFLLLFVVVVVAAVALDIRVRLSLSLGVCVFRQAQNGERDSSRARVEESQVDRNDVEWTTGAHAL